MQRCTHLFPGKALVSADTWLPPAATVLSSHDHSRKAIALEEQKTAAREYYAKMITTLEKRKTTTEKSRANWQQKHTDSLELYEKGAGTFLDVQNAYIQTRVKMSESAAIDDQIWYYSWLKNNLIT